MHAEEEPHSNWQANVNNEPYTVIKRACRWLTDAPGCNCHQNICSSKQANGCPSPPMTVRLLSGAWVHGESKGKVSVPLPFPFDGNGPISEGAAGAAFADRQPPADKSIR